MIVSAQPRWISTVTDVVEEPQGPIVAVSKSVYILIFATSLV